MTKSFYNTFRGSETPYHIFKRTCSIFESEKLRKSFQKRNTEDRGGYDGMMGDCDCQNESWRYFSLNHVQRLGLCRSSDECLYSLFYKKSSLSPWIRLTRTEPINSFIKSDRSLKSHNLLLSQIISSSR
jgi:hypothetical protein